MITLSETFAFALVAAGSGSVVWIKWPEWFPPHTLKRIANENPPQRAFWQRDYANELRLLDLQIAEAKRRKAKRSHLYAAKEAVRTAQLEAERMRGYNFDGIT